jgi:copper chaperone NosL
MSKRSRTLTLGSLVLLATICLAASLKLPLWSMRMEAPQYRDTEALRVTVYPGRMDGDLREIVVLNQYIGVHIPETLPQTKWLPTALIAAAVLGLGATLLPGLARRSVLTIAAVGLTCAMAVAVFQAKQQMHDIGHKRDAHTKLARVQNFDPPFLGTAKIAQFTVSSRLGSGAILIGSAVVFQLAAAALSRRGCRANCQCEKRRVSRTTVEATAS